MNIPNFAHITGTACYRSGQPIPSDWPDLAALGIVRVVKLNGSSWPDGIPDEPCLAYDMEIYQDPISSWQQIVTEPDLNALIGAVDFIRSSPGPALVHCEHGQQRTGIVVGLFRLTMGWTVEAAYEEMIAHGFPVFGVFPEPGLLKAWKDLSGKYSTNKSFV